MAQHDRHDHFVLFRQAEFMLSRSQVEPRARQPDTTSSQSLVARRQHEVFGR